MRTTETITISLPPAMVRDFERVRKAENRTRSELMREALRVYFEFRYPEVAPTRAETAILRRGRAAYRRGDYVLLRELLDASMKAADHRAGQKGPAKTAGKRTRAH